ncbi:MAG: PEP-CTERM sorting domain-containing protein [Planctomycetota bacterium]
MAHTARADVNVQLNLRYDNPGDESLGGTWELLAGSTGGGLAGLVALVDNINDDAIAAGGSGYAVFESQQVGTVVEIVTGHDDTGLTSGATDLGLGSGTTGNVADDLFTGNSPAIWAENVLLASGSFGAIRPTLLPTSGTLTAGANEFSGSAAVEATVANWTVRGDGVATDGLLPGDANRDGNVNASDVSALSGGFGGAGTWDQGDFSANGTVGPEDVSALSGNFGGSATPPAISAVPEPTSLVLLSLAAIAGLGRRQR